MSSSSPVWRIRIRGVRIISLDPDPYQNDTDPLHSFTPNCSVIRGQTNKKDDGIAHFQEHMQKYWAFPHPNIISFPHADEAEAANESVGILGSQMTAHMVT